MCDKLAAHLFYLRFRQKMPMFDSAENEQKSSADEREVYKGTPSEETGIEQKNNTDGRKRSFQP